MEFNFLDFIKDNDQVVHDGGKSQEKVGNGELPKSSYSAASAIFRTMTPVNVSECSITAKNPKTMSVRGNSHSCASQKVVDKIKETVGQYDGAYGCKTEKCVIEKSATDGVIDSRVAKYELKKNFKLKGPTDVSLLNNFNIDGILNQWSIHWPDFYPYDYNMVDYEQTRGSLATVNIVNLYKKGYRTFGCVINSDKSTGRGKHWMALFVDLRAQKDRKFTVEFFNSSGNKPVYEFAKWLVGTKSTLDELVKSENLDVEVEVVKVCDIMHQYSRTECGVYSLYYIYSRLNGISYDHFKTTPISDILCFEFRQHLFRDPHNPQFNHFDYKKFSSMTNVKWESDATPNLIEKMVSAHAEQGKQPTIESQNEMPTRAFTHKDKEEKSLITGGFYKDSRIHASTVAGIPQQYYSNSKFYIMVSDMPALEQPTVILKNLYDESRSDLLFDIYFLSMNRQTRAGGKCFYSSVRPHANICKSYIGQLFPDIEFVDEPSVDAIVIYHGDGTPPTQYYSLLSDVSPSWRSVAYFRPWSPNPIYMITHEMTSARSNIGRYITKQKKCNIASKCDNHNKSRQWLYYEHFVSTSGIDGCWDCMAEIYILSHYLGLVVNFEERVSNMIEQISSIIGTSLICPPHGIGGHIKMVDKYDYICVNYGPLLTDSQNIPYKKEPDAITEIYIMRHAETDNNAVGIIQGVRVDPNINENGKLQTTVARNKLAEVDFDVVYSSPARRASQTAKLVAQCDPIIIKCLHDMDMAQYEGMKIDDAMEQFKSIHGFSINDIHRPEYKIYHDRIVSCILDLISRNIGKKILIVTHARASVFKDFIDGTYYKAPHLKNTEYLQFKLKGSEYTLQSNYSEV